MEKEFVPYEIAVELKQLGFDEPCLAFWDGKNTDAFYFNNIRDASGDYVPFQKHDRLKWFGAPLYQQAFRWFREKYDLVIEPCVPFQRLYLTEDDHFEILEFGYRIYSFDQYRGGLRDKIEWDGYDNSNEEKSELECLKKLIEMVKNK